MMPSALRALICTCQILRMFGEQDRLGIRRTPRYRKDSILSSRLFKVNRAGYESIQWKCMHALLVKEKHIFTFGCSECELSLEEI